MCVIEYGWYVGRGGCGVCGWKDRCRDGNLRTYCHVSPITNYRKSISQKCKNMLGWLPQKKKPNKFRGFFGGRGFFLGLHSLSMNFFHFNNIFFTCNLLLLFFGGKSLWKPRRVLSGVGPPSMARQWDTCLPLRFPDTGPTSRSWNVRIQVLNEDISNKWWIQCFIGVEGQSY